MAPPLHPIISRLHLKQLRLLGALASTGSLLKASQQLALTQPGASNALQEIETTFGTPLFVAPTCRDDAVIGNQQRPAYLQPRQTAGKLDNASRPELGIGKIDY
jgi:hypothetical protein